MTNHASLLHVATGAPLLADVEALRLFDAATSGNQILIAAVDRDLRYLWFNAAHRAELLRLTGKTTELGMSLVEVLSDLPAEREQALAIWGAALMGNSCEQEIEFGDPGRRRRWFAIRHAPLFDAAGAIIGASEVVLDVTERRKARERLGADHELMARLHRLSSMALGDAPLTAILAEVVDEAILIDAADFGTVQLLDAATGDLRIVAHRGLPEWWLDFWNNAARGAGVAGSALELGERVVVGDVEHSNLFLGSAALDVQRRAGVRAVQSTPLVSHAGRLVGVLSTQHRLARQADAEALRLLDLLARSAADLIEHHHAAALLRATEERYRCLLESVPDAVISLDLQWRVLDWNAAADRLYGWRAHDIIGQSGTAFLPPACRAETAGAGGWPWSAPGEWRGEALQRRRDGSTVPVLVSVREMKDRTGQVIGYLGINRAVGVSGY